MLRNKTKNIFSFCELLILFIFFILLELRWGILLFGLPCPNPYVALAIISALTIILYFITNQKYSFMFIITFILIIHLSNIALVNIPDLENLEYFKTSTEVGGICINICLFIIASDFNIAKILNKHSTVVIFIYFIYALTPIFVLLSSNLAIEAHFSLRELIWLNNTALNSDFGVSYQSYGDKIVLLTFFILSLNNKAIYKIISIIVTFISLFVVGSKASILGFIFAITVYIYIYIISNKRHTLFILFSLLYMSFAALIFVFVIGNPTMQDSSNWLIASLSLGQSDQSVELRKEIENDNKSSIISRLCIGDYKFDYKLSRPGTYTHNIWGVIDYYGIIIFVIIILLWIYYLIETIYIYNKTKNTSVLFPIQSLAFYSLLFIVARPFDNYLSYFVMGTAVSAISKFNSLKVKTTHTNKCNMKLEIPQKTIFYCPQKHINI